MTNKELQKIANEVRKGIVTAVHAAGAGHPGGSLSAADIYTYLYFEEMNIYPKDPKKADRDRFVLSNGHASMLLYALLHLTGYNLSMEEYRESMKGIYTSSVCEATIDEAPMAYKSLDDIIDVIKESVEIVDVMKPIYNFKAAD